MAKGAKFLGPELPPLPEENIETELKLPPNLGTDAKEKPVQPEVVVEVEPIAEEPSFKNEIPQSYAAAVKRPLELKLFVAVGCLLVLVVLAVVAYFYLDTLPSPARAYRQGFESLAEATTVTFDLNVSYKLLISREGFADVSDTFTLSVVGKFDKPDRELMLEGDLRSLGNSYVIKQVILANQLYLKYGVRDYITTGDLSLAVAGFETVEGLNFFPRLEQQVRYGYGAVENLGGETAYRFRVYPSQNLISEYLTNLITPQFKAAFTTNTPSLDSESWQVGNAAYRVWVAQEGYFPKQLQLKIDQAKLAFTSGSVEISELFATIKLLSLNAPVTVDRPV